MCVIIAIADDNLYKKSRKRNLPAGAFSPFKCFRASDSPDPQTPGGYSRSSQLLSASVFPQHRYDLRPDLFGRLLRFLKEYAYPGNIHELYNLSCSLFTRYSSHKLQLSDLATYLRSRQMADVSLTDLQYQVLSFVSTHPKAGRLAIKNGLADGETFVSEAALRTVLGELSSAGYLIVHRTKGGCEISELGRMVLEK